MVPPALLPCGLLCNYLMNLIHILGRLFILKPETCVHKKSDWLLLHGCIDITLHVFDKTHHFLLHICSVVLGIILDCFNKWFIIVDFCQRGSIVHNVKNIWLFNLHSIFGTAFEGKKGQLWLNSMIFLAISAPCSKMETTLSKVSMVWHKWEIMYPILCGYKKL